MKLLFVEPNMDFSRGMNIGLAYLMSTVDQKNRVKLFDANLLTRKKIIPDLKKTLRSYKPHCAAFSVNSFNLKRALEIAKEIKKERSDIFIIFGGAQPTLFPEATISLSCVDAICIGEGEAIFPAMICSLEERKMPDIEGLWTKNKRGEIRKGSQRLKLDNLDILPYPSWDYFDVDKYFRIPEFFYKGMPITGSRGCPWSCPFCYEHYLKKQNINCLGYRKRDPVKIVDEIKFMYQKYRRYDISHFDFADPTFGCDREQFLNFCNLMKGEGLNKEVSWTCQTKVDIIDDEWAYMAAKAGCIFVGMGVESFSDKLRNEVYKKDFTYDVIHETHETLKKHDILSYFLLMAGGDGETKGTLLQTENMINKLRPFDYRLAVYWPMEKSNFKMINHRQSLFNPSSIVTEWPIEPPKGATKGFYKNYLIKMRVKRWKKMLQDAFNLRGAKFILDVIKYLFSKRKRVAPLTSVSAYKYIVGIIIFTYFKEEWLKKRHNI